ncbi:MAG: NAD(P)/FAD-dependent oxidoreductase [Nitrospirales bacterium]|nr:NAD(P)/FAD-dependent oxidoreductase [Nitrospirales bacterium]MBA3967853.1 NAD(P)/FAD-dependent oxidoreductase [Nitrospirales bacterium]
MTHPREVIIIGGGLAGLSAAIYLGRGKRDTLLIHSGRSMAKWEPEVQNYPGFSDGIAGAELLNRCMDQAARFEVEIVEDEMESLTKQNGTFHLRGVKTSYLAKRVLLATGLTHLPPEIPGVRECLGTSLFFCKDCDAFRLQGKRIIIIGRNNEAADYALGMLLFTPHVMVATNGEDVLWDDDRAGWLEEYGIHVRHETIQRLEHEDGQVHSLVFARGEPVQVEAMFTTRGDVCHNTLAEEVGARLDAEGQIRVDACMETTVPGLYAAGCVTPGNCQMVIAAGQGATAAQAINRDLFDESLRQHALPRKGKPSPIPT